MNKKHLLLLFLGCFTLVMSCQKEKQKKKIRSVKIESISIDSSSVRAILASKDSSLFYATDDGFVGLILKNGEHLRDQIKLNDSIGPNFRSIATNGQHIFVLSIGNPARLYKYDDGNKELVYKEEQEKVFYNAMAFFDENDGIAMGDPTDNCLSVLLTNNGGDHWQKLPCGRLPMIFENEAAFAASNGNIAIVKDNVWLVTGGAKARVFYSPNRGDTWQVYDTPIISRGKMTGIFSVDFFDSKNGIIFGGDWQNKADNKLNKAITNDGGKTWKLVADGKGPGYRSSVRYIPDTNGKELVALGSTGISYSDDGGHNWQEISNVKDYYTIRFVNKNFGWLAGKYKIAKITFN